MKANLAKIFGYLAGALLTAGGSGSLGKYSGIATAIGALLTALGIHQASGTNGSN